MPLKIRSKLLVAFFAILFPFTIIAGTLVFYNASAFRKAAHKVETVSEERAAITNIILAMERVLMPGNDYLITADRKYIDDFYKASQEVEKRMKEAEGVVSGTEDMNMLGDTEVAWRNIKDISQKIFEIQDPQATVERQHAASLLMEEMDYRWAYPAIERLKNWRGMHLEEYKKAVNISHKVWVRSWIIMGIVVVMLIIGAVSFAFFYSNLFVKPIKSIHESADSIARGEFKTRLDIKTGDELQQLSGAMNEMAEKLDSFYGTLENQVMERTRELQESEDKYRTMIESANDMIWTLDREGLITFINSQAVENAGYAVEEVIGKHYLTFVHPEDRGMREEYFKRTLSGERTQFTVRASGKDHGERTLILQVSSAPIYKEGKIVGTVNFGRDITELKKTEEALKESEERYRGIFEKTPNAMVVFDAETLRFENVNSAAIELYGYTEEEFLSLTPVDVSAEVEKTRKSIQNGLAEKSAHVPVRYHKKKDGTVFPIEIFMGTFLSGGRQKGFAVIVDLTEIKKAEEKLKFERDKLIKIFEAMEDGVYIVNQDYDIEYINPFLEKEYGPWKGIKCYTYFHDRTEVCPWCPNQRVFAGETVRWEWYSFKNGKTYDLLDTALRNPDGSLSKLEIFRDITDKKKVEEALRHERDMAHTYLDIAGVMFVVIDSNEKVSLVNKKGAEVLGCPGGEIIGKSWFDEFLPERVRDEIKDVFRRLMRGEDGSLEYFENPVLTCSGEERIIAWHNTALKDETGKIIATLSSGEDITESEKAKEGLKQRFNELEQFRKVTIKRELRMEELQRKVDELEKELKRK